MEGLHAKQRSHAAADGRQQKQRPFRDPADGVFFLLPFGLPLIQTKDQKGDKIDNDQPAPQQGPGGADEKPDRVVLRLRQRGRRRGRTSCVCSSALA